MKVTLVGTGYVGLVSGVCLAHKGHDVTCIDLNQRVVEAVNAATPHIYERGLPDLLRGVISAGRFRASVELAASLLDADIAMIAVGTPSENGVIDLRHVRAAVRQIGAVLRDGQRFLPVVVKSTVIPGTTDTVVRQELEQVSGRRIGEFGLGMNPEFLREGEAVQDFLEPDRIVLGHEDPATLEALETLYAPWNCQKIHVPTRTAELIKYASNALLAVQISAINEIANLASAVGGIDIMDVVAGVTADKRWSPIIGRRRVAPLILSYLIPGCGFGGSCFPKDVQALRTQGLEHGLPMAMLNAVLSVNESQPHQIVTALEKAIGDLCDYPVLLLGLAFKPGTDDVRESPSLTIVQDLLDRRARVRAHDPIATKNFITALGPRARELDFLDDWSEHVADAQAVLVVTRWPDYAALAELPMVGKIVFDVRRMFAKSQFPGATYMGIGLR
jgi:UDPglucose 6-dehydrogenase/GDP-mannose 6-dehydrogenase